MSECLWEPNLSYLLRPWSRPLSAGWRPKKPSLVLQVGFFVFSTHRRPTWYDHVAWAICWGSVLAQSNLRYADRSLSLASSHLHFLCLKSLSTVQPSTAASIAAQGASAVVTRDTQLSSWWLYRVFCIKYSSYQPGGRRRGGLMISGYREETSVFHRHVSKLLNNWGALTGKGGGRSGSIW